MASLVHNRGSFWLNIERSMAYVFPILDLGSGFIQLIINPNRRAVVIRVEETVVIRGGKNTRDN